MLKRFKAVYWIPKMQMVYECDVFAMDADQARHMYQSSFMELLAVEEVSDER